MRHTRTQKHATLTSVSSDVAGKSHQSTIGIKRLEKQEKQNKEKSENKNTYPTAGNLLKSINSIIMIM